MENREQEQSNSNQPYSSQKNGSSSAVVGAGLAHPEALPAANWTERLLSDPMVRFVWRWRSQFFGIACVILLGVLYYTYSQEAFRSSMNEAARVFSEGRAELVRYNDLVKEREQATKTDATTVNLEGLNSKIGESLKLASAKFDVLAQSPGIYETLGRVYKLVLDVKSGQLEKALNDVQRLDYQNNSLSEDQKFYYELAWLFVARSVLDSETLRQNGLGLLQQLTKTGQFAAVPAAITLTNLAESDEERKTARETLDALLERQPAQGELIEQVLESL